MTGPLPATQRGAVLAGVNANPSGWPAASVDPRCGRHPLNPPPEPGSKNGPRTKIRQSEVSTLSGDGQRIRAGSRWSVCPRRHDSAHSSPTTATSAAGGRPTSRTSAEQLDRNVEAFDGLHPCAVTELLVQVAAGDAVGAGVEAHPVDGGEHLSSLTECLPVGTDEPERGDGVGEVGAPDANRVAHGNAGDLRGVGVVQQGDAMAVRTMVSGSLLIQSAMPAYRPWAGCRCGSIAARSSSSPLAVIVDAQGVGGCRGASGPRWGAQ